MREEWAGECRWTCSLGDPGGRGWLGPGEREQSGWRTRVCFDTGATGLGVLGVGHGEDQVMEEASTTDQTRRLERE